jgi:hypothetical protein
MSHRYGKSVPSLVSSSADLVAPAGAGYGTRNAKRRKLNLPPESVAQGHGKDMSAGGSIAHTPMYSRNLDKALKSILSEPPKQRPREETENDLDSTRDLESVKEGSSTGDIAGGGMSKGGDASISTGSVSSHDVHSRETTPSNHGEEIPEFITFYEKRREEGRITGDIREQALQVLRQWRQEWLGEDKRVRELKRKIRNLNAQQMEIPSAVQVPVATAESKSKGTGGTGSVDGEAGDKGVEGESRSESPSRRRDGRRDSITGPNGLTGSYWDVPLDEMGRGSRRRTKA